MSQLTQMVIGSVETTSPLEVWIPACLDTVPASLLVGSGYSPVVGDKVLIYIQGPNVLILGGI